MLHCFRVHAFSAVEAHNAPDQPAALPAFVLLGPAEMEARSQLFSAFLEYERLGDHVEEVRRTAGTCGGGRWRFRDLKCRPTADPCGSCGSCVSWDLILAGGVLLRRLPAADACKTFFCQGSSGRGWLDVRGVLEAASCCTRERTGPPAMRLSWRFPDVERGFSVPGLGTPGFVTENRCA